MNDLIDRQLAIDAMENVDWYHINKDGQLIHGANSEEDEPLYKAEDIYNVLEQLPSAEPEIIRCKDCKHWSRESICDGFCAEDCMRHDEDFYCGYAERKTNE